MGRTFLSLGLLLSTAIVGSTGCDRLNDTKTFHEYTIAEWCEQVSFEYGARCNRTRASGRPGDEALLQSCMAGQAPDAMAHKKTVDVDRCNRDVRTMSCAQTNGALSLGAMPSSCWLASTQPVSVTQPPSSASVVPVAATATEPAPQPQPKIAPRGGDVWTGTYVCRQGETPFELRFVNVNLPQVNAVFEFTAPKFGQGRFTLSGEYDADRRHVHLVPRAWLVQPPGYTMVGLTLLIAEDGRFLAGSVQGTGCTSIQGRRK